VNFARVLKEVLWCLVAEGSISYRRIKLSFGLDHDGLEELRRELIGVKRVAADVDGQLLVWAPDGRVARPEPMALPQPLPALRHAEMPTPPAAKRDPPAVAEIAPPPVSPTPVAPAAAPDAERRQLTVMFCDLVGSTALSTGMDLEDLRDVIASFQSRCSAAIRRYDGFVAKYMGDGILVYFGYPRAHEDEAERSVRAGLDIVEAMAELNAGVSRASRRRPRSRMRFPRRSGPRRSPVPWQCRCALRARPQGAANRLSTSRADSTRQAGTGSANPFSS